MVVRDRHFPMEARLLGNCTEDEGHPQTQAGQVEEVLEGRIESEAL